MERDARAPDAQPAQRQLVHPRRELRVDDAHRPARSVRIDAEDGAQQEEHRARGPGLRRARDRVADRLLLLPLAHPAEQFRQPVVPEVARRRVGAGEDLQGFALHPVVRQAHRDDRIVVRPDGAVVVAERVVGGLAAREGPDPPAVESLGAEQSARHLARLGLGNGAGPEQVPHVGGGAAHLLFLAVQRDGVGARPFVPERLVDAPGELDGPLRAPGGLLPPAQLPVDPRHAPPRIEAVALHFHQGDGRPGGGAVQVRDAVARVLPALVLQAPLGLALVLDESVAVLVAVLVDPAQRSLRGRQELVGGGAVARPL